MAVFVQADLISVYMMLNSYWIIKHTEMRLLFLFLSLFSELSISS